MKQRLLVPVVAVFFATLVLIPTTLAVGESGTTVYAHLGTNRFPGGQGAANASLTFNSERDIVLRVEILGPAGTNNSVRVYVDGTCANPGEWVINRTTNAGPDGPFLEVASNTGVHTIQVNQLDVDRIRGELAGNPNETFALMVARVINGATYRTCTPFGTTVSPPLTTTTTTSSATTTAGSTTAATTTAGSSTTGSTTAATTTAATSTVASTTTATTTVGSTTTGTTTVGSTTTGTTTIGSTTTGTTTIGSTTTGTTTIGSTTVTTTTATTTTDACPVTSATATVSTIPGGGWINGWDNTAGGTAAIVASPSECLGTDSVQLSQAASTDFAGIGRPTPGPLSDLTAASWMTYVTGASGNTVTEAASLRISIYRLGFLSEFTTLNVNRPENGLVTTAGVWQQTELTDTTILYQSNTDDGFCTIASPCTFAAFKAHYPDAFLLGVQVAIGTGNAPATSYVDGVSLTRGGVTDTWDFELE